MNPFRGHAGAVEATFLALRDGSPTVAMSDSENKYLFAPFPPPQTTDELINRYTITQSANLNDTCGICDEKYFIGEFPEAPVILPRCTHIFGANCLETWINTGNNSCPMCRKRIIGEEPPDLNRRPAVGWPVGLGPESQFDPEDDNNQPSDDGLPSSNDNVEQMEEVDGYGEPMDEGEDGGGSSDSSNTSEGSVMHQPVSPLRDRDNELHRDLTDWRPEWEQTGRVDRVPTEWATHGEALYSDLCEAIVCRLEDPCNPESWLRIWYPIHTVLQCVTFEIFCREMQQPGTRIGSQIISLEYIRRTHPNMQLIQNHLGQLAPHHRQFLMPTAETHARFSRWYARIRRAHDRQLEALNRERAARKGREYVEEAHHESSEESVQYPAEEENQEEDDSDQEDDNLEKEDSLG